MKKLSELNARLLSDGRDGVGLSFDCPCGCGDRVAVYLDPPMDGGKPVNDHSWKRTGDSLDDITLSPSILIKRSRSNCGWHGFVENGKVRTV